MAYKFSSGNNPISTTIATIGGGTGVTSFTITSASGLPTVGTGEFGTARIADGTASAETITYTRSGTTITCSPTTIAHAPGATVDFDILCQPAMDQIKDDAISGYPVNALTTGGALVKGTGITNRITISTAQTFTLANGTYHGELCRILIDRTSTNLATIDPAGATTIDGASTRIMWAGETALLAWNGTEWEKIAGKSIPMIGAICLAANTASFPNSTETLIAMDTSVRDNTGLMVNTGANKITVKRDGLYDVQFSVQMASSAPAVINGQGLVKINGVRVILEVNSFAATGYGSHSGGQVVSCTAGHDAKVYGYQNAAAGATTIVIIGSTAGDNTRLTMVEIPTW